ncbi:DinB family protein [Desulfosporosinus metallidurans]|uniref:DinB family protein n=1 Tax=Desulfosporosinus metallidurans TaxID=1888891 RepID=A0A1Q8QPY4_9FIRM|nr:DinB family protein [Desulfosporosinus metallidurans]OLN29411.1 DinB family protein [Desulfosporosinus metallidurans]
MNKNLISELYEYNNWANEKLLNELGRLEPEDITRDLSSSFRSIQDTMVHILAVEELWVSRWMGEQTRSLLIPDDFPTYSSLAERWNIFRTQINDFLLLLTEGDLVAELSYKNIKGITYSLELWKQILHVTNHSSYHRGQVVTMIRQLKKQPPSLDLIYYYLGER